MYAGDPKDSIVPEAINQGNVSDCDFLGPLASLAGTQAGKESLSKMIEDNGVDLGGRHIYTVTFPGAPKNPLQYRHRLTQKLHSTIDQTTMECGQSSVAEKAYGKYVNSWFWRRDSFDKFSINQDALKGFDTMAGHKILSHSHAADAIYLWGRSQTELSSTIGDAMENGQALILVAENTGGKTKNSKLVQGHAYSIIGLDTETNMVQIRNTWGRGEPMNANGVARDGVDDGIFEMSLADLNKDFDKIQRVR